MKKEDISAQFRLYEFQYEEAIQVLLHSERLNFVYIPLMNLVIQYLENFLKKIYGEFYFMESTPKSLKIDNMHDLSKLLEYIKIKYNKYLEIKILKSALDGIEDFIKYAESIFGKNLLINARYALKNDEFGIVSENVTIHINCKELKKYILYLKDSIALLRIFYKYERVYRELTKSGKDKIEFLRSISNHQDISTSLELLNIIEEYDKS